MYLPWSGSYKQIYRVMKAVVRSAGSMLLKDGVSQPSSCGAKEVLVDVKAAGINPVDYKVTKCFSRNV